MVYCHFFESSFVLAHIQDCSHDLVTCLAKRGAKVNVQNKKGSTPVHILIQHDDALVLDLISCLFQGGKVDLSIRDAQGFTPLGMILVANLRGWVMRLFAVGFCFRF